MAKQTKAAPAPKTASHKPDALVKVATEKRPKLEHRQAIYDMVPAKGIKYSALVSKVAQELEITEEQAARKVEPLFTRGFLE